MTAYEADSLTYVVKALNEGQEYDAGNTILFLIGTERLSENGINKIADLLLQRRAGFNSKIGKIIYPKMCFELWKLHVKHENFELANRMKDRGGFE